MFKNTKAFSGFAVRDLDEAQKFYGETLGLKVVREKDMGLALHFVTGAFTFLYPKEDHQPATFTVLNFPVDDIDAAVEKLNTLGIEMERFPGFDTDEKGILRSPSPDMGPDIAWFRDPSGNILAVLEEKTLS